MAIFTVKCSWMHRPYTVRGSAPKEAEEFIVTQSADRIEIFWHYTNRYWNDFTENAVLFTLN